MIAARLRVGLASSGEGSTLPLAGVISAANGSLTLVGSCGWMIAHGHSGSCRYQAAWYDENYASDVCFGLVSAVVTLSGSSYPVTWLLV